MFCYGIKTKLTSIVLDEIQADIATMFCTPVIKLGYNITSF
jgi:hypothetical protein